MLKLRFCIIVLGIAFFAGCNMLVVQRTEKREMNHAIPPTLLTGNIVGTGTLGYEEKKTGFFAAIFSLFSKKEERIPVAGEILVKGSYKAQGEPRGIYRIAYPQKNKNLPRSILIDTYHVHYKWTGDIMFSDKTHEANFLIDADGTKAGDRNKTILLDTAETAFSRFEFSGPIGDTDFEVAPESGIPCFPWWVGDFISEDKTCRLYAVVKTEPEYTNPPGLKDPYAYETRKTFFYPEQKFQIVDTASNTVLVEIYHNAYTLYDTTPETEREAMKCNIGLFYALLQVSKQIDASSSW